jgi:hypothetical protein
MHAGKALASYCRMAKIFSVRLQSVAESTRGSTVQGAPVRRCRTLSELCCRTMGDMQPTDWRRMSQVKQSRFLEQKTGPVSVRLGEGGPGCRDHCSPAQGCHREGARACFVVERRVQSGCTDLVKHTCAQEAKRRPGLALKGGGEGREQGFSTPQAQALALTPRWRD